MERVTRPREEVRVRYRDPVARAPVVPRLPLHPERPLGGRMAPGSEAHPYRPIRHRAASLEPSSLFAQVDAGLDPARAWAQPIGRVVSRAVRIAGPGESHLHPGEVERRAGGSSYAGRLLALRSGRGDERESRHGSDEDQPPARRRTTTAHHDANPDSRPGPPG